MHHCIASNRPSRPSRRSSPRGRGSAAFTLIEAILALAITGIVVGGVFAVARSAMQVSEDITESQEQAMTTHSFVDLLRRNFEQMPGNGQIELRLTDKISAGNTLSEVVFKEYPLAFSWAGVEAGAKTVVLRTERESKGSIRAHVFYLTDDQAKQYSEGKLNLDRPADDLANLPLIEGIKSLEWSFYDDQLADTEDAWQIEWDAQKYNTRRPSLVNLYLEFYGTPAQNIVFWIPTMVNPQTFANANAAGAGSGATSGTGNGLPGGGSGFGGSGSGGSGFRPGNGPGNGRNGPGGMNGGSGGGRGGPGGGGRGGPGGGGGRGGPPGGFQGGRGGGGGGGGPGR